MTMTVAAPELGSIDVSALGAGVVATLAYFAVGSIILAGGFLMLDWLTPGNLRHQVYVDRNPNAAILLSANHLGLGAIVVTAILTSAEGYAQGLLEAGVYGVLGIILQAIALRVLDALIPGNLRALVQEPKMCGAAWAVGVTLLVIGLVNAAALS